MDFDSENEKTTEVFENPWQKRESFPKMPLRTVFSFGISFGIACLSFLFVGNETVNMLLWAVLLGCGFYLINRDSAGMILLSAFSGLCLLISSAAAVTVTAIALGIASGVWLWTVWNRPWWLFLIPVGAGGIGFAVLGDWKIALSVLCILPAVILLGEATLRGEYRTAAICFCVGGLLISLVAALLLTLYWQKGAVNAAVAKDWVLSSKLSVSSRLQEIREQMMTKGMDPEAVKQVLSGDAVNGYVALLFNLLPAVCVALCAVIGYFGQRLFLGALNSTGMNRAVTLESEAFTVGIPSAVLFTVCFAASCFADVTGSAGAIFTSISLILLPAMGLAGFTSLWKTFGKRRDGRGIPILISMALVGCCTGQALWLLGLWGAYDRVARAVKKKIKNIENDRFDSDR